MAAAPASSGADSGGAAGGKAEVGGISDADDTRMGLFLDVVKAKSVAPKDKTGLSDPYLIAELHRGGLEGPVVSKWVSDVCIQTLNPRWRALADFVAWVRPSDVLEITAWDKDLIGSDDPLGVVRLKAGDFVEGGDRCKADEDHTFERLASAPDEFVSGALVLRVAFRPVGTPAEEAASRAARVEHMVRNEQEDIEVQEAFAANLPAKSPALKAEQANIKAGKKRLAALQERSRRHTALLVGAAATKHAEWQEAFKAAAAAHQPVATLLLDIETYRATGVATASLEAQLAPALATFEEAYAPLHKIELECGLDDCVSASRAEMSGLKKLSKRSFRDLRN